MTTALVISARDNVATALEPVETGHVIRAGEVVVTAIEAIPRGHKIALRDIRAGEPVVKYGSAIGLATTGIVGGAHVHTHNVASVRGRGDLGSHQPVSEARIAEPPDRDDEVLPEEGLRTRPYARDGVS